MNNVKLVAMTKPMIEGVDTAEQFIAYCARVSNPSNQLNNDTAEKLLQYCVRNDHWSIFETVNIVMSIETTRDIARQILRHRSFSFQEFCLSGDTEIYFAIPRKLKNGQYKPTQKMKIKDLYDKWHNGAAPIKNIWNTDTIRIPLKDRLSKMYIKCFDENTNQLSTTHIKNVFYTGSKPIFEITLKDGKKIKTTKEHKFLTKNGFLPLEEIVGLQMINERAVMMNKNPIIGVNGIPSYQNKEWLEEKKKESLFKGGGIPWIAKTYGVNYNTIRKWLKLHNLQFTKQEVAQTVDVWNKGKYGYKTKARTYETRQKQRLAALARGKNHNWYRGGNSHKRETLSSVDVAFFRQSKNNSCDNCGVQSAKIDLHHIIPVSIDPSKQHDVSNWQLLCEPCHIEHHRKSDYTGWQAMGAKQKVKNSYSVKWIEITSIVYLGEEDTYDLEVEHISHNYVANGIIVHNSQRYAQVTDMSEPREARLQDPKNRQNSIKHSDEYLMHTWNTLQEKAIEDAKEVYEWAIKNGIAKEQARVVLPEGLTMSRMYMNGTLRSWITYCKLRMGNGTQLEHREIATQCWNIITEQFPSLKNVLDNNQ